MEMPKPQDRTRSGVNAEPILSKPSKRRKTKPASSASAEQNETDALLLELAEFIESEGGVLIP